VVAVADDEEADKDWDDKDRRVYAVQRRLVRAGFLERDDVDGEYGPKTQQAVRRFQRENDLKVSGSVRPNLAEGVTVEARVAATGQIYMLPVQFAGAQGVLPGLDQVTVMLVPELKGAGAVQLTLIVNGRRSGGAPSVFIN